MLGPDVAAEVGVVAHRLGPALLVLLSSLLAFVTAHES